MIDGTNAIDLNTEVAPVITKLSNRYYRRTIKLPRRYLRYAIHNPCLQPVDTGFCKNGGFGNLQFTGGDTSIQQSQNGLVALEAEDYDANFPRSGHQWVDRAVSGSSGTGTLAAMPDIGGAYDVNYVKDSPRLDYSINFVRTGIHYVWIRAQRESGNGDSLHVGLDNTPVSSGHRMTISSSNRLDWSNRNMGRERVVIDVPTVGEHTLNIWMREDGAIIDKVVLTTIAGYVPSRTGPVANPRENTSIASGVLSLKLRSFGQGVMGIVGFGISPDINIFSTPPIITSDTVSVEEQQLIVQYRAAIEALSSMLHELSLAFGGASTADELLAGLANHLYDRGNMDALATSALASAILLQNPMTVQIANTEYQVQDIVALMDKERVYIAEASSVEFYRDQISVGLRSIQVDNSVEVQVEPEPSTSVEVEIQEEQPLVNEFTEHPVGVETLLHVDFNNRSVGAYAQANIISDFNIGANGYNDYVAGAAYGSLDIVSDPAGSGRGNVMRVRHNANTAGNGENSGGMSFRADFEKKDDVYLAYDMYLPQDHEWTKIVKHPGLITGTMLQASHAAGVAPVVDGNNAFSSLVSSDSPPAWPSRGYGALSAYYYDAEAVQRNQFLNKLDPSSKAADSQYNQPKGRWVTIEMRVKMNTVTEERVSGLKDGLLEIWVTDPQSWAGVRKVSSKTHRWRTSSLLGVDGLWMLNFYGGKVGSSENRPSKDNFHFYDNFVVSSSPITH